MAIWLTVHDWNLLSAPKFVGIGNFERMLTDKLFWQSLKVTLTYTLVAVPLGLLLGLVLALLLNAKTRGITVFRTVYYLPSIVPAVATATNCSSSRSIAAIVSSDSSMETIESFDKTAGRRGPMLGSCCSSSRSASWAAPSPR